MILYGGLGWLLGSRIAEYSCAIRAKLCFIGIDGFFCLIVDGWERICRVFMTGIANTRNCYIVLFPQLFNVFFQLICGEAAHGNTAYSLQIAARQLKAEIICNCPCILAIEFEEIPDLIQYNIVRMGFFDGVIAVIGCVPHRILRQRFVISRPFLRCQITVLPNEVRYPRGNPVPAHFDICAVCLSQRDALRLAALVAATGSGHSMGTPADAVFFFQKICLFFLRVRIGEIGVDSAFPFCKAAAAHQGMADLVLGDELYCTRHFCHAIGQFIARQAQILQPVPDFPQLMIVKTKKILIQLICCPERGIFVGKVLLEHRVFQCLR